MPFGDTFGVALVGDYNQSDGYYENGATYGPTFAFDPSTMEWLTGRASGEDVGGDDIFNGRVKALWEPNEDLSLLFQYEIVRDRSGCRAGLQRHAAGAGLRPVRLIRRTPGGVCSSGTRSA